MSQLSLCISQNNLTFPFVCGGTHISVHVNSIALLITPHQQVCQISGIQTVKYQSKYKMIQVEPTDHVGLN